MARPSSENLTPREAQIMSILWELGRATADEVREALSDDLHDSTVRTLLRVLETKGYAKHKVRGKSYVYSPRVTREKAEARELRSLIGRLFGGSPEALVLRLIEDDHLTPRQLDQLARRPADKAKKRRRKGGAR